jgi:hypothetical protein
VKAGAPGARATIIGALLSCSVAGRAAGGERFGDLWGLKVGHLRALNHAHPSG